MRQHVDRWLLHTGIFVLCVGITASGTINIAYAQQAADMIDETAMAFPHLVLPGSDRVDFPRPLSPSDVVLIRHILELQANGSNADADREIARLGAGWMVGPILAARYLNPNQHPTSGELRDWLHRFGEQSDSDAIEARLNRIQASTAVVRGETTIARRQATRKTALGGAAPGAIRKLFTENKDAAAIAVGQSVVLAPDKNRAPDDLLAAGLAAWRQNDVQTGILFLTASYESAKLPSARAAAAFWIAHIAERNGTPNETWLWLRRAALAPDTFYGRIARRKLGLIHTVDVDGASDRTLGVADFERLLAIPRSRRAFGLLQIGEKTRAERELRALSLDMQTEPELEQLLVTVADAAGMPKLAEELRPGYTRVTNAAVHRQTPRLRPDGGFILDPTIVYGIVQHESNFHNEAVSSLGALGLMQIMPATARGIGALTANQAGRLAEPGVNLSVGQRYILVLANDPNIHGDLLRLLSAYGQGQGAMKRWVGSVHDGGDPIMFLEAVPSPVLRAFLFDALAASWGYAVALRLPAPSLDALAEGRYPTLSREVSGALSAASAARATRSDYLAHARY